MIACFPWIAERDKSRPYACRQMPTLSRLVEDTKLKGMFLVTLTIFFLKPAVSEFPTAVFIKKLQFSARPSPRTDKNREIWH